MFNSNFPVLAVKTIKIRRSSSRVLSIKNGFKESVSQDLLHTFFMTNLPGPLTNPVLYLECVSENVRLPSLIIKKVKIISFLSDEVFIIHDKDINNFELSEQCFGSGYIPRRIRIEVCIELHLDMDTKHCAREFNLIRQYAVCSVPPWSNIHKIAMNFTRSVS